MLIETDHRMGDVRFLQRRDLLSGQLQIDGDLEPRHMRGGGKGRGDLFGIALVEVRSDVARDPVMDQRRPGWAASLQLVTAGSGSMSTNTISAASLACATVSATTITIGSPT